MNLSGLLPAIRRLEAYQAALGALRQTDRAGQSLALRLQRSARAPVAAALAGDLGGPCLLIAARADRAAALAEELGAWAPGWRVLSFLEPNPLFYEYSPWGPRTVYGRLTTLAALAGLDGDDQPLMVVASARALMSRTLPQRDFRANTRTLKAGQSVRLEKLLDIWVGAGYQPATIVVEPGQFARRGGIIDVFPAAGTQPVRLELFGDEIETLRLFDPATQRSGERVEQVTITPAREALPRFWRPEWMPEPEAAGPDVAAAAAAGEPGPPNLEFYLPRMFPPASIVEYLPDTATVLVDDWRELANTVEELEEQAIELRNDQLEAGLIDPEFPLPYHPWGDLQDEVSERPRAPVVLAQPDDEETTAIDLGDHFGPGPRFGGQLKPLLEHLHDLQQKQARTVVVTRQAQRLAEMWSEQFGFAVPAEVVAEEPHSSDLLFVPGALSEGWRLGAAEAQAGSPGELHLLTDAEIFGWSRPDAQRARRRPRPSARAPEAPYSDLAAGDYVVHMDYGIGRFHELVRREVEGVEREYLLVEYAEGDELYVPIHQADRLTRYVGVDETQTPSLSRLGTAEWTNARARSQEAAAQVARDLLDLYARRESAQGNAYGPDTVWQSELEASFPYVETDDQLRALREVKADLESPRPMDRLICGDVGYGKTEVALRAAFKAVMDGCQVAVLVPTTVLAQQHLHTFRSRLSAYPVQVEMLSRFRSRAEAEAIIKDLAGGRIDIVIGTHRLLQKDVQFKNLGLVIIDEEQRFGVTHKEYLKKLRTEVDVLTLTATPIPRTLYLSLTGVRDISTINTPPEERLPIITHVGPYNERLVRQAILRELDRDGQVFFVHNRVQSIGVVRHQLERLVPEARIGVGHGQMDERELSRVMEHFTAGDIDVLLSTSIIESGLDIPNTNTLIVDRADTFGLAQLYQLRGRVGRGAARAYAYFFYSTRNRPTPEAYQRLETLAEQTDLGAGYGIAMRDLEMRGAGDILGARQHGHIAAVGFHLYTRLLADAVRRLKRGPTAGPEHDGLEAITRAAVTVDLPISTAIPADYVPDQGLRLRIYRRLADITREEDIEAVAAELADRFGPLPLPVENLLYQLRVKILAGLAGVSGIGTENGQIVITAPGLSELDQAYLASQLGPDTRTSKSRIWLGRIRDAGWQERLVQALRALI
jgi:transcription-repair coupling factor (superfamily II helicase)